MKRVSHSFMRHECALGPPGDGRDGLLRSGLQPRTWSPLGFEDAAIRFNMEAVRIAARAHQTRAHEPKWSPPLLPAMSDNEEIGDEQKLQIAQRLIKSSPPGQARLVTAGAGPQLGLPLSSLTQAPARRLHRRRQDRALAYSDRGCGQERDRAAQHRTLHAGGGRWRRSLGARWMRRASGQPRPARPGERACRASPSIGRAADAGERRQPRGRHAFHRYT